jgi:hypothetical protein
MKQFLDGQPVVDFAPPERGAQRAPKFLGLDRELPPNRADRRTEARSQDDSSSNAPRDDAPVVTVPRAPVGTTPEPVIPQVPVFTVPTFPDVSRPPPVYIPPADDDDDDFDADFDDTPTRPRRDRG